MGLIHHSLVENFFNIENGNKLGGEVNFNFPIATAYMRADYLNFTA